jgi:hypothetical protein
VAVDLQVDQLGLRFGSEQEANMIGEVMAKVKWANLIILDAGAGWRSKISQYNSFKFNEIN